MTRAAPASAPGGAGSPRANEPTARSLRVTGIVQGVGFRPFVYRIASQHGLAGWVKNVAGTVEIHVEGDGADLAAFERALTRDAPPISRIDVVQSAPAAPVGVTGFTIEESVDAGGHRPVPADVALCPACEREMRDPRGRRYRHPFISCTDCGPRYSVIESLPYDRERTTMADFAMCDACRAEYTSPGDRRHHAETIACNGCGPVVWLAGRDGAPRQRGDAAIRAAAAHLAAGDIVALRGMGGFHLACDATNEAAVSRLRARKHREAKPLAVMVATLDDARRIVDIPDGAASLLLGPEHPIVLLPHVAQDRGLAPSVAPGIAWVGVVLPYTPIHQMIVEAVGRPLVMTSGNLSDEPIAIGNAEALARLGDIADHFLLHDREILSRVDDSVVRFAGDARVMMRRSRGYAPAPLRLPIGARQSLLAVGPHLKNTFTLARGDTAFVSPHIGDLENVESLAHFRTTLDRYCALFRIEPELVVRDTHPGYLSTRIAAEFGLEVMAVQHHHAHIAAVMAEHEVTDRVVGVALDGTGFGDDGNIWGAEVFVADLAGYERKAHLAYVPLPGGDAAARDPWRVVQGWLARSPDAGPAFARAFDGVREAERQVVIQQLARRLNTTDASSMGRLFDAAAAILGVRNRGTFEGQAAMELESLAAARAAHSIEMPVSEDRGMLRIDPLPVLVALGERAARGDDVRDLAAVFHESVIAVVVQAAGTVAASAGISTVALGGGSFQNARLLAGVRAALEFTGLRVIAPVDLPPNDGGISYGQAAVAAALTA